MISLVVRNCTRAVFCWCMPLHIHLWAHNECPIAGSHHRHRGGPCKSTESSSQHCTRHMARPPRDKEQQQSRPSARPTKPKVQTNTSTESPQYFEAGVFLLGNRAKNAAGTNLARETKMVLGPMLSILGGEFCESCCVAGIWWA